MGEMQVELIYVHTPNDHFYVAAMVPIGTTIHALIHILDLPARYPEVDMCHIT